MLCFACGGAGHFPENGGGKPPELAGEGTSATFSKHALTPKRRLEISDDLAGCNWDKAKQWDLWDEWAR